MNVGILLPLSHTYPGISKDFMDGLNTLLLQKYPTGTVTIKKESAGFGGIEKDVYSRAEKLLVSDDVDILVAYIDEKVTDMLYSLIQATGKLLILVNPGANHTLNWIPQSTVVHLNLHHAFLSWLTGAWAAGSSYKQGAYSSTFYDCGYLHSADMVKNFIASGGNILYNSIYNKNNYDDFEIQGLTDFLTFRPDCENILCVYDELPASLLYEKLREHKRDQPLHLFGSPMMMTEKALEKTGKGYNFSIHGHIPWQPALETEFNQHFIKSCTRPATIFSLLGWETGLILDELLQNCKNDQKEGEPFINHLKKSVLNGPRGEMKLDPETLYYTCPVGRVEQKTGSTVPEIEWISDIENEWRSFTSLQTEGTVTGWTNTYLCY